MYYKVTSNIHTYFTPRGLTHAGGEWIISPPLPQTRKLGGYPLSKIFYFLFFISKKGVNFVASKSNFWKFS